MRVTASDCGSERASIKKFATASSSLAGDGGSGTKGAGQTTGINDPGYRCLFLKSAIRPEMANAKKPNASTVRCLLVHN